ncbi:MAG: DUF1592 domain-containing protein [Myxococcota bacterium]
MRRHNQHQRTTTAAMLLSAAAGCVGALDGPSGPPEPSSPSPPLAETPSPGPEMPRPPAGPGTPGAPGAPGSPAWSPAPLAEVAPDSPSARLRAEEYRSTVAAVFELGLAEVEAPELPSDGSDAKIFTTNARERIGDFQVYVDAAAHLSPAIAAALTQSCSWSTDVRICLERELRPRLEQLYRSSVAADEIEAWEALFRAVRDLPATEAEAVESLVNLALLDERFLFHREQGRESEADVTPLTDAELASRLSYLVTNGPPDAELRSLATSGELRTRIGEQIRRLYESPAADAMIWRFVSGWLSLPEDPPEPLSPPMTPPGDECNLTSECQVIYGPQATDCVNSRSDMSWCACGPGVRCAPPTPPAASLEASAWEETRRFVLHIFRSELPLSELFSARYSFIDAALAEHYGVPPPQEDWQQYAFEEAAQRRGIFSHASFLMTNSSEERDVTWIFRGKAVYERLFCGELGLPMEGAISEPVEDRQNHPLCGSCHSIMDPLGKLFDAYDAEGKYVGTDLGDLPVLAFSDIDGDYASLSDFVGNLENSRAFEDCFARMWLRFALGRPVVRADTPSYTAMASALSGGGSARAAILGALESEAFELLYRHPDRKSCP